MPVYRGKRALDLALVTITAPIWVPLLLATAPLVRIFIGSPVFFRQQRPGLRGHSFALVKFRTMTDARDSAGNLLPDAQRLTRFGRYLWATSLDELPELLNVIRGEMSIVGPRPLLFDYLALYSERERRRHDAVSGLTRLAQIAGRRALSWKQRFELDVGYVERCSFPLDISILFRTFGMVVRGHGISAPGDATMPPFTG